MVMATVRKGKPELRKKGEANDRVVVGESTRPGIGIISFGRQL